MIRIDRLKTKDAKWAACGECVCTRGWDTLWKCKPKLTDCLKTSFLLRRTVLLMIFSLLGVGCFHVHYQQTWIRKTYFYSQLQYLPLQQRPLADIWKSSGMHLVIDETVIWKTCKAYVLKWVWDWKTLQGEHFFLLCTKYWLCTKRCYLPPV